LDRRAFGAKLSDASEGEGREQNVKRLHRSERIIVVIIPIVAAIMPPLS
jgi:hypothetical protein